MKIELGKRYVMRNGNITPPLRATKLKGTLYPFIADLPDVIGISEWSVEGFRYSEKYKSEYDLIAEA